MEAAIRWSPNATPEDARFLVVDVEAHTVKLCEALGVRYGKVQWNEISRNSKIPSFRAFDWSAAHDLVALGHMSGATVIGLTDASPSLSLPLKLPRNCNAVSFNSDRLLASGIEKVRNDYCLNIYDVSHWQDGGHSSANHAVHDPLHKLSISETVTSIKFFPNSPQMLVAGIKGTCIRLYDLREHTGNPSLQFPTSRVHNIGVDFSDDWYFAAAGPPGDSTVQVWDRRSGPTSGSSRSNTDLSQHDGPVLELPDSLRTLKNAESPSIWGLRFSPEKSGCLGIMGSNGSLRICQLKKDQSDADQQVSQAIPGELAQQLSLDRTQDLKHPDHEGKDIGQSRSGRNQIVSFDFMTLHKSTGKLQAITLGLHQEVHIHELYTSAPLLAVGPKGEIASSDFYGDVIETEDGFSIEGVRITATKHLNSKTTAGQTRSGAVQVERKPAGSNGWVDWQEQLDSVTKKAPESSASSSLRLQKHVGEEVIRTRAQAGYLFDAGRNIEIVSGEPDVTDLWRWLGTAKSNSADEDMVCERVDFSYLGIRNLIDGNMGSERSARSRSTGSSSQNVSGALAKLSVTLGASEIPVHEGPKLARRQVALHAIGFSSEPDALKLHVQRLALAGRNSEAALRALILDEKNLLMGSLTNGPRRSQYRSVFDDVSKWAADDTEGEDRSRLTGLKLLEEEDPYVHAIYFIIMPDDPYVTNPLDNPSLPFEYRLAIALRFIPEQALDDFLEEETSTAIKTGDISRIMLTGLSDDGLQLLIKYVQNTGDVQTAILAISHVAPKYIRESRAVDQWRDAYRRMLNVWGLHLERCLFDVQASSLAITADGRSLLEPSPPQVALRCGNCEGPIGRDVPLSVSSTTGGKMLGGGVLGGPNEVTQCPRCGAKLPRCAICDMHVGVVDPLTRGGAAKEQEDKGTGRDPMADMLDICVSCAHVNHRGCAEAWFARHRVCPAVGCDCTCDDLDVDEWD